MTRIIVSVVLLLFFCVLVVLNIDHTTAVNVIWATYERVSIVVVGLVGFAGGVIYSFLFYASRYFAALRKRASAARGASSPAPVEAAAEAVGEDSGTGDAARAQDPAGTSAGASAEESPPRRGRRPR
jgi:hypothetical protein